MEAHIRIDRKTILNKNMPTIKIANLKKHSIPSIGIIKSISSRIPAKSSLISVTQNIIEK